MQRRGDLAAVELQGTALGLGAEHEIKRIARYNCRSRKDTESFRGQGRL